MVAMAHAIAYASASAIGCGARSSAGMLASAFAARRCSTEELHNIVSEVGPSLHIRGVRQIGQGRP